nr:protein H=major porin {N-terminal} [Pasteurella multocida, 7473, Peptide Partial, 36 aa] [Pasteurella multocida]
ATVYNQDGTKVDGNGSVRLLLKKEKDKRGDLMDNGS